MKYITDIEGVYASGIHCGIKKTGAKDLAYISVPEATGSAGVFTKNQFCAACVTHTKKHVASLKAMIINSGNANAGTGENGAKNVKKTAKEVAQVLGIKLQEVGVASTGIIGVQLPMDKIESGIKTLLQNPKEKKGLDAAEAILTTDTFTKCVSHSQKIGKKTITVAGIAKGSGMIEPNMATMLAYIVTDADMRSDLLQRSLKVACDASFNMISVDTDTSTSDMVVAFASGAYAFNKNNAEELAAFQTLLTQTCIDLAKLVIQDGEGATKIIECQVTGAATITDAKKIAKSIINSPLIKTAIHGEDPNWGRIIMAIGKTPGIKLNPNKVSIRIGDHLIFEKGEPLIAPKMAELKTHLAQKEVVLAVDLGLNKAHATAWGCDLSKRYIDINTDYN